MALCHIQCCAENMKRTICTFLLFVCADAKKLPSYITPCKRNSDISSCILENLEAVRPNLSNGVPRLSIPPLNPLKLPRATMSLTNFTFDASDLNFYGLDKVQFKDLEVDPNKEIFNVNLFLSTLDGTGDYTMKGCFLGWTFDGASSGNGSLVNVTMSVKLKGTKKLVDGKQYIEFKKVGFKVASVDKGNFYFDNLIRDDPEMSKQANDFINRPEIFQVWVHFIDPMFDAIFGNVFYEIVNNVFLKFPVSQLFPEK